MAYNYILSFLIGVVSIRATVWGIPHALPKLIRHLPAIALDGKRDCKILDDQQVIPFFQPSSCDDYLPPFPDGPEAFFELRKYLVCFGSYDALYNLCEFDLNNLQLAVPEALKAPASFCNEAAKTYTVIQFDHKSDDALKWSGSLKSTLTNRTLCGDLCMAANMVDPMCSKLVALANEYIRLKAMKLNATKTSSPSGVIQEIPLPSEEKLKIQPKVVTPSRPVADAALIPLDKVVQKQSLPDAKPQNKTTPSAPEILPPEESQLVPEPVLASQGDEKKDDVTPPKQESFPPYSDAGGPVQSQDPDRKTPSVPLEPAGTDPQDEGMNVFDQAGDGSIQSLDEDADVGNPEDAHPKENIDGAKAVPAIDHEQQTSWMNPVNSYKEANLDGSYTFSSIATIAILCFLAYFLFHYKNKLLALALEGRKSRSSRRGRPSSANYSKLHSNLEEAIASNTTAPSATHVLY